MDNYCKVCFRSLKDAQYNKDGKYKSCPKCSKNNGYEHIFYNCGNFGYTELRITHNNPKGIQSWCSSCRGKKSPSSSGILCSEIVIK